MPIENLRQWCDMSSEPVIVDTSSDRDSLVIEVTIEEEIGSMSMGSSSIPKKKRGVQRPMSPIQKKKHTTTHAWE